VKDIDVMSMKYLNKSTIGTQFFPDADEIKNMYTDKPLNVIITTLLENIDSITVPNKNEHILQFFNLYQKQKFRFKTEMRKTLFLGSYPMVLNEATEIDIPDISKP